MAKRVTFFTLFLSVVLGLIVGVHKYSLITNILYYFTFIVLVLFSYRIYLIIEKLGVRIYEIFIKKFVEEIKEAKKAVQEE